MFTDELDRTRHPIAERLDGVIIGSALMAAIVVTLISARTAAVAAVIMTLVMLATLIRRDRHARLRPRPHQTQIALSALITYCFISTAWSQFPSETIYGAVTVTVYAAAAAIMATTILTLTKPQIYHVAEGFWTSFAFGLAYLLFEFLTGQYAKILVYNSLGVSPEQITPQRYYTWANGVITSIHPDDLTRNIFPLSIWIWPALIALAGSMPRALTRPGQLALYALAAAVIFLSEHESSKMALLASTAIFLVSQITQTYTHRLLCTLWIIACLGSPLVAIALHRADLHNASWLQNSARHRIVIWNTVATEIMEKPVLGHGANTMYEAYNAARPSEFRNKEGTYSKQASHAHSLFLQIWYEIGAVGIGLLLWLGLAILNRIRRLNSAVTPYVHATFAAAMAVTATSYGIWQVWLVAVIAITVPLVAIAIRAAQRRFVL